jgi:hypothetical protein
VRGIAIDRSPNELAMNKAKIHAATIAQTRLAPGKVPGIQKTYQAKHTPGARGRIL